jgi:hypothetical protein
VIATPTTRVDVLRGTAEDDFGDTVDTDTVVMTDIPASIIERTQRVHEPKDGQDRIVNIAKGRLPRGTGVLKGDRLRDRTTGVIYVVDNVYEQANPFWRQDQSLDLSLTS